MSFYPVTMPSRPDRIAATMGLIFRLRVVVLAACILAAILPALVLAEGRQQTAADHARMMAMAGHLAHMAGTDGPSPAGQMLLCQQVCLFPLAALPAGDGGALTLALAFDASPGAELPAASLAIPPPGPPPRSARL